MGNSFFGQGSTVDKSSNDDKHNNDNVEKSKVVDLDETNFDWDKDPKINQIMHFEIWYPFLSKYTPKSSIIDCNRDEIDAITAGCDAYHIIGSSVDQSKLTPKVQNTLNELGVKIQKFIDDNEFNKQGIFVRFSNRSPKDAVLRMNKEKFYENVTQNAFEIFELQRNFENFDKYDLKQQITNCIIRAMTRSSCADLCCYSGNDAINLIVHSQRIFQDFKLGDLLSDGIDGFKPKLILREFDHRIDFEYEFRVFVFKGELTAITQYNQLIYLPKIVEMKQEIETMIVAFWKDQIHPNLVGNDITSYVMDVALLKKQHKLQDNDDEKKVVNDDDDDECGLELILIELNPFSTKAGAMLFDWKRDVKIMTSLPMTFRILNAPFNSKPEKLTSELDDLYQTLSHKLTNSLS